MVRRGETRRRNGLLRRHGELDEVEQQLEGRLVLQIAPGDADRKDRRAVLEHECRGQGDARTLSGLDTVRMPRGRVETAQAVAVGDARAAAAPFVVNIG